MSAKQNGRALLGEAVRLRTEAERHAAEIVHPRNRKIDGLLHQVRLAIASGDYSIDQARSDIKEMELSTEDAAAVLGALKQPL